MTPQLLGLLIASITSVSIALAAIVGFRLGRRSSAPADIGPGPIRSTPDDRPAPSARAIERALADLRLGVVVVLEDGSEVYRNRRAAQHATGRHGDALVEAALERVIDGAFGGLSLEESVQVYGPPARSFLVQASPTHDDGQLSGAIAVIDDVTEARRIDRVRSDFVANVSHELRTPVGAMSVLAETIAQCDDPPTIDRLSERMQREADRLGNTIDDLLALSRLESGPITAPATFDLVSVAATAAERTQEAAGQLGVAVVVENGADGPLLVEGDHGQLVSAVANLIDNGIKYSNPGAVVEVRLGRPSPDGEGGPDWPAMAQLSVADSGIGIPDPDLDRIFERFYRVDTARSRRTGGTGLGLSIVRHAVLNHGGTIGVDSTEGQGSTFTIWLPLVRAEVAANGDGGPR